MRTQHIALCARLGIAAALCFACGTTEVDGGATGRGAGDPGILGGAKGADGGAGTGGFSGLPCDVQKTLEDGCIGCHGGSQAPPLRSYAELTAQSSQYPGQTVAQRSLARMQATTSPMPPPPAVAPTAAEIATFQQWVNAGAPMGTACTSLPDAGASGGTNYNTPPVCTSGKTWAGDNSGEMDPGRACLDCHQKQGGPRFAVGGTVYPTAHEPDNCYGVATNITVIITDKNGAETRLPVNATGNFYSRTAIAPPFSAKVTDGVKTRAMVGSITAGDCNSCHTQAGANGAPGRIVTP